MNPSTRNRVWAVWMALVLAGGFACGSDPKGEQVRQVDPQPVAPLGAERFAALQPETGDTLVPPRIGFRWEYRDVGGQVSSQDVEQQELLLDNVEFRIQVIDGADAIHADYRTAEREILVTLPPTSSPGRYTWWLEVYEPGKPIRIAESERSEFYLRF